MLTKGKIDTIGALKLNLQLALILDIHFDVKVGINLPISSRDNEQSNSVSEVFFRREIKCQPSVKLQWRGFSPRQTQKRQPYQQLSSAVYCRKLSMY